LRWKETFPYEARFFLECSPLTLLPPIYSLKRERMSTNR